MNKNQQTFTTLQLISVKAHIGNKTSQWNPLTKGFLFGSRLGIHIFDLRQVIPYYRRALYFISRATRNHQVILFVGTNPLVSLLIKFLSSYCGQSSLSRRWVAGTLTNWLRLKPYIKFLYTTSLVRIRERFTLRTEKKIEQKIVQYLKMKHTVLGLERMTTLPNLVIFLEPNPGLREAQGLMIPVIGITSSGPYSPLGVHYPLFGNDHLFDTLFFYTNIILQAMAKGLLDRRLHFMHSTDLLQSHENVEGLTRFLGSYRSYKALGLKRLLRRWVYLTSIK